MPTVPAPAFRVKVLLRFDTLMRFLANGFCPCEDQRQNGGKESCNTATDPDETAEAWALTGELSGLLSGDRTTGESPRAVAACAAFRIAALVNVLCAILWDGILRRPRDRPRSPFRKTMYTQKTVNNARERGACDKDETYPATLATLATPATPATRPSSRR
eukprot:scaffold7845_cov239-Pinguiococcus_pyrenoidosus.AAC.3